MFQKRIFTCLATMFSLTFMINAQPLKISNSMIMIDEVSQPAIKVLLEPESKAVKKAYKKWMEGKHDVDIDGLGFLKNKDVLKSEKQTVKSISPKKIDLFARIVETKGKTEMQVYGNLGYDIPITPTDYPTEYANMHSLVYGFLNNYLPGYYEEQVEDGQDMVDDLKDDKADAKDDLQENKDTIRDLMKENEDLATKIKEYESKLKSAESQLTQIKEKKTKVDDKIKKDNK